MCWQKPTPRCSERRQPWSAGMQVVPPPLLLGPPQQPLEMKALLVLQQALQPALEPLLMQQVPVFLGLPPPQMLQPAQTRWTQQGQVQQTLAQ